jgi:hypothetical protein
VEAAGRRRVCGGGREEEGRGGRAAAGSTLGSPVRPWRGNLSIHFLLGSTRIEPWAEFRCGATLQTGRIEPCAGLG